LLEHSCKRRCGILATRLPATQAIASTSPHESPPPVAAGSDEISRQRVGSCRGNVRAHWRAALANAYPVLLALGGDAWFDALSLAYARAHPSRSGGRTQGPDGASLQAAALALDRLRISRIT
jgi:Putative DNA-binding domain